MPRFFLRAAAVVLAATVIMGAVSGCAAPKRFEAQFLELFDTMTTIVGYYPDKDRFSADAQALYDDLEEYHRLYNIYDDFPGVVNIKSVNAAAGKAPVKVDARIIDLLKLAKQMYAETGGRVNVALGSVLSIWHEYRERGIDDPEAAVLPPMEELEAAAAHTDIDDVIIDEAASTIFLKDARMSLDVGAIAKGYAAQRVCDNARARGVTSLLVSVGGNVCAIGRGKGGAPWGVGVQKPDGEGGESLETAHISDLSLVTSGDYQRYYMVGGTRYHHIINPATLMPAAYFRAVTIICGDSGRADALSTAVFNMSLDDGLAFVEALPSTEALWLLPDGTRRYSSGFAAYGKG